jgi:hypothetical protein
MHKTGTWMPGSDARPNSDKYPLVAYRHTAEGSRMNLQIDKFISCYDLHGDIRYMQQWRTIDGQQYTCHISFRVSFVALYENCLWSLQKLVWFVAQQNKSQARRFYIFHQIIMWIVISWISLCEGDGYGPKGIKTTTMTAYCHNRLLYPNSFTV